MLESNKASSCILLGIDYVILMSLQVFLSASATYYASRLSSDLIGYQI